MSQLYEFYDKLEYDEVDLQEILSKIKTLADTAEITDANNAIVRFRNTARVMENNISLFHAVFGHVDIVTNIIECLNSCSAKLEHSNIDISHCSADPLLIIHILSNLSLSFYENVNYFLRKTLLFCKVPSNARNINMNDVEFELVLLEDSDLHAVMFYLIEMYKTNNYYLVLTKILIQEPIKEKFLYYKEKHETQDEDYALSNVEIKVFRSKQELLTMPKKSNCLNYVSIWSEDIITAKNLAISLNRDFTFINGYGEFYTDILLLPKSKILEKSLKDTLRTCFQCDCGDDNTVITQNVLDGPVSNLFYNGSWQKPVEERYWMHNNGLWAQAEWNDISNCVLSASKGFKTWSTTSVDFRIQILSKFAHSLACTGKVTLANIVRKWMNFPCIYENSIVQRTKSGTGEKIEVTKIREGRNIIIIKEETETALFDRLTQTLIAGNSVIVICDANFYNLAPYCDMLSASTMPPGVVNLLSHKNIHHLEHYLCGTDYATYKREFFSEDAKETYNNLTALKQILLYL